MSIESIIDFVDAVGVGQVSQFGQQMKPSKPVITITNQNSNNQTTILITNCDSLVFVGRAGKVVPIEI